MSDPHARQWDDETDVLVFGSGVGGLAASLFAAKHGQRVLLCEKSDKLGGTTATSGGIVWIPNNSQARRAGFVDSKDKARTYLRGVLGNLYRADLVDAYLDSCDEAIEYLAANSDVKFSLIEWPDYHPEREGGMDKGRSLLTQAFDGRTLGADFERVRPPIHRLMILGGMMVGTDEIADFLKPFGSCKAFKRVTTKLLRHVADRLRYSRGTDVRNGNALVSRFFFSLRKTQARIWTDSPLRELIRDGERVVGAVVERDGRRIAIRARRGVVLATGGFPHNFDLHRKLGHEFAHRHSVAYSGNVGEGIGAAVDKGAVIDTQLASPGLWSPASAVTERDGSETTVMYGYLDRGRPGVIAVDPDGKRFVNESNSYHDIVTALHRQKRGLDANFYFVCDYDFVRKYGMGLIRPFPITPSLKPYVKSGYIAVGETVAALARQIGVPPDALENTVAIYNGYVRDGTDKDFQRGFNAYNRQFADAKHMPNPNLALVRRPPFVALKIRPATLGTAFGLKTTADAQVVGEAGAAIPGLYACGTEMASAMRGYYPGGGINLGPGITFAFRAVRHMIAADR